MIKRKYVLIIGVAVVAIFLGLHLRHSDPMTDLVTLHKTAENMTGERVLHLRKLNNEATDLLITTDSPSGQHNYTMIWSGSKWQISKVVPKPNP
jgi:hypothetical protein